MSPKHLRGRDLPHPERKRAGREWTEDKRRVRVHRPDGSSFPANIAGEEPRRPAIGMLFEVLHVCSGGLPPGEGIRVDIRPEAKPDIIADGRKLPLGDETQKAVLIDPPYTEHYARDLYGTDYPRPAHLLLEAARVVRPCGRIGFVHYIVPNAPPKCRFVRAFGLSMGFGYPMRAVTIFEREQGSLFGAQ